MNLSEITDLGGQLLNMNPDPAPRFRIMRDVLKLPQDDALFVQAKQDMLKSKWVMELAEEQWENGSWGRFHTQNTKVKHKIITTEWAISRGLELGLDKNDEIFKKTIAHMENMLNGVELPLDNEEHHYGFRIAFAYLIAGNLSKIDPVHPLLPQKSKYCADCTIRAFQSGQYDEKDWTEAYMELNEVMLRLFMIHPLLLLQSEEGILPENIELKLLNWIWNRPEGIYYITNHCPNNYQDIGSGSFHYWLRGVELLSNFKHWRDFATGTIVWLNDQRGDDGLWDYGKDANSIIFGHYSESWRNRMNRKIDCSTRILALMRKYLDKCLV